MATTPHKDQPAPSVIRADTDRAVIMGSAVADNLMSGLMAVSAEIWSVRRRLKIVESLMTRHGAVTSQMVEAYVPTAEETTAWQAERDAFVHTVMDPFARTADIPYASTLRFNEGKDK